MLLVGYEILAASGRAAEPPAKVLGPLERVATRAERQRLADHAKEALEAVGFLTPHRPIRPLHEVCWMLDRAGATAHEVRILHGMLRRILWTASREKKRD